MYRFGQMHLKNLALFDDVVFDWDFEGTTVVRGQNLNSSEKGRSNGSGKSLLVRQLPGLLLNSHPVSTAPKAKVKRDVYYRKGASGQLSYLDGTRQIDFTKYLKGQSLRYDIRVDQKALEFNTATAAENWMEEDFRLTPKQVWNTVYLDNRSPIRALLGGGTERFNLFSDIYTLDDYDLLKDHFLQAKAAIRDEQAVLTRMDAQLADLERQLADTIKDLTVKGKEVDQKHVDKLVEERDRMVALQQRVQLAKEGLRRTEKTKVTYDEKLHSKLLKESRKLEKQIEGHDAFIEWDEENRDAKKKLSAIDKKVEELKGKCNTKPKLKDLGDLVKQQSKLSDALEALEEVIAENAVNDKARSKAKKALDAIKAEPRPLKSITKEQSKVQSKIDVASEKLEQMQNVADGKCPTCGSKFNPKHIKDHIKDLNRQLDNLNVTMEALDNEEKDANRYAKLADALAKIPESLKVDTKELKRLNQDVPLFDQLVRLIRAKAKIEIEPKPSGAKRLEGDKRIRKKLEDMEAQIHELTIAQQQTPVGVILQTNGFKDKKALTDAEASLKGIDLGDLRSKADIYSSKLSLKKRLRSELAELKPELKKLRKSVSKIQIVDALVSAYSNSGLKRLACADLAKRVEGYVNEVAPSIFDEGYKFYFDVTPTNFEIKYEAKHGLYDVEKLSGAESGCFNILAMLGILPTLPSSQRTNVMVLDELDANMDGPLSRMFCNELIPALNQVVPHVVVVTPKSSIYPNSRTVTVVKKGETSTVVMDQ